jgi:hypothetical protein
MINLKTNIEAKDSVNKFEKSKLNTLYLDN